MLFKKTNTKKILKQYEKIGNKPICQDIDYYYEGE